MFAALAALLGGSLLAHDGLVAGAAGDGLHHGSHLQAAVRVSHSGAALDHVRVRRDRSSARLELRGFVPAEIASRRSLFVVGSLGVCEACASNLLNSSLSRGRAPPV